MGSPIWLAVKVSDAHSTSRRDSTTSEGKEAAAKAFADAKASVLGWKFGTDLLESGLDPSVVPGAAGSWAV